MGSLQARLLEPEWLDSLSPEDVAARDSRRDLQRLNALMGHRRSLVRLLRVGQIEERAECIIDLGSGDGCFALEVIRSLRMKARTPRLVLVDRQLSVDAERRRGIEALGWKLEAVNADVFEFVRQFSSTGAFVMANLFLHHFEFSQLRGLFEALSAKVDAVAACEPRRSRPVLAATSLLPLLGCNSVTRHDADISVRAGFRGRELSKLWPAASGWDLVERPCGLFSHGFVALRK